jgi:Ca-activated chloride channel family protein
VLPVVLGPRIDAARLAQLASISGGQAYFPEAVAGLEAQYARVIENLRHRYIVGYTSTNSKRDGAWRKVEILTRSSGILVSSRDGYFAPDK